MIRKILSIICLISSTLVFGQRIAGGKGHSLFICADSTVLVSGNNASGQLGLGDLTNRQLPEKVKGFNNVKAVAGGKNHSLFLKSDGTVWATGDNSLGQCANTVFSGSISVPLKIAGLSNIVAVAAGDNHSLFLKGDGTVWACGNNSHGQLGNDTRINQTNVVQVIGLSGIVAISAGDLHSLFLKNDGTVWSCGQETEYVETLPYSNKPIRVPDLENVIAIATGKYYSLYLKNDGTVRGSGYNGVHQLGYEPGPKWKDLFSKPGQISGLTGITAIAAGEHHSLFLKNDGTVLASGANYYYQGGVGHDSFKITSVPVNGLSGVSEIYAGFGHSLFLKSDGTIWSCGMNEHGQQGTGHLNATGVPTLIGNKFCAQPQPPTVDMSNFPSSVCLGSNLNVSPNISGSNPVSTLKVDNSIQVNNPKAITKNSHSVFVLNDNDEITRFDFDGNVTSSYPNLNFSGIQAFAADDSSHVYLFNGDGKIYKCDSTGTMVDTVSVFWASGAANQLVFTTPVASSLYPSNLFLIDAQQTLGVLISGINTYDKDPFNNSTLYQGNNYPEPRATSMSIDNFYENKRALLADPTNSTLHSRILYYPSGANPDFKEEYLVDSASTAGMSLDFISTDTLFNFFTVSSSSTGILGYGASYKNADGSMTSFIDTNLTSDINPIQPVGMISTPLGSTLQLWVADRGQNRILRAYPGSYQITPKLPEGLVYNPNTGEVTGTPVAASAPQTYQVKLTTPYGTDSSQFTFGVSMPNGVKNAAGTGSSTGQQKDGLAIKYYDANNCEKLIDIADSLGGTAPGYTRVSQTVYPVVSVIANNQLIRRATQIEAENIDTLQVNVTFYYTFDDIQLYKQSTGSSLSNDTSAGTMQMAVLQMHELPNGGREPIIHSPITAEWVSADQNWKAVVPVTKFSEFYAGDMATIENFDCTNDSSISLTVNNPFYIWNYDTLFTSDTYIDTLINQTGCDSIVTLNLTLKPNGVSESALASGIQVYPNPGQGIFTIRFENNDGQTRSISVTNLLGEQVYATNLKSGSTIDLSNQNNGVYFISIQTDEGRSIVFRVIKM